MHVIIYQTNSIKNIKQSIFSLEVLFSPYGLIMVCATVCVLQDCDFDPLKYNSVIECEKPNNDLNRFRGYM